LRRKINTRLLPPLSSLKGFEAATRRQSIRGAAEELNLTHSAISHQIEALEQSLGVPLFSRVGRSIASTEEGRMFYPFVRNALESLIDGVESVRRVSADKTLRVQTYVTASIRWLAGRVPRFLKDHPDVRIVLSTCAVEWEYDDLHSDVGLVYCETPPDPTQFRWLPLFPYSLVPVCSPALAARLGKNPEPAVLRELPLITIFTEEQSWESWFESAGLPREELPAPVYVDTLAVALEMALAGGGVALANGPFMEEELRDGRLVQPVAHTLTCAGNWGLICRNELGKDRRVQIFMTWMAEEAGAVAALREH
jgi:LysR family glycine cleavage system transcriptional activator